MKECVRRGIGEREGKGGKERGGGVVQLRLAVMVLVI